MTVNLTQIVCAAIALLPCATLHADITGGLVGHWTFDEAASAVAYDSAGAHNGNIEGGVSLVQAGRLGYAFGFDGSSGRVQLTGSAASLIPATGDFSVFEWIRWSGSGNTETDDQMHLFSNNNGQTGRANFGIRDGDQDGVFNLFWFHNGGLNLVDTPLLVTANTWQLAGLTRSNGVFTAWLGTNSFVLGASSQAISTAQDWRVGSSAGENRFWFNGAVDDVRVYNRALNTADVAELVAQVGPPVTPPFPAPTPNLGLVPGVVIDYSPKSTGKYLGSPSIVIWTNGDYIASHDDFDNVTTIFKSTDRGSTWQKIAVLSGQDWSTLFVNNGSLYIIGSSGVHSGGYGSTVIRRSTDEGETWTAPADDTSGLLLAAGSSGNDYHCAPSPVIVHAGRIWRAMEHRVGSGWAPHFRAFMMSAPVDADLLNADNWTFSSEAAGNSTWLNNQFGGWLEGNAVATRDGRMLDMLRVDTPGYPETAAIVTISTNGTTASFDPITGFINFPGGAKKFTIRYDAQSDLYWTLATWVQPQDQSAGIPGDVRNTLALTCSSDLTNWTVRCILLYHPDTAHHGFQYADWQFDGDDIIAAVRTAYDDGLGGADSYHNSNLITFQRIKNFRALTMTNSYVYSASTNETADFVVTGSMWRISRLDNGDRAFLNRAYTWVNVPSALQGWRITQTWGDLPPVINVRAKRAATLRIASVNDPGGDWTPVVGESFNYTDASLSSLQVYQRNFAAGETLAIPQSGFPGRLVLLPDRFGLLARWKFEETNGLDVWDSANHFDGFRSSTGTLTVPNGANGRALQLDRLQGGFVKFNNVLNLAGGDFSLAMWVRLNTNDATAGQVVLGKSFGGTTNGWFIGANVTAGLGGVGKSVFFDGNPTAPVSQISINDGRWHQLVAINHADDGAAIYVDGAPVTAPAASILTSAAQLVLGGWDNGATAAPAFTGWIDEVQIYDRALSDTEINFLFRNPDQVVSNNLSLSGGIESRISAANNAATLTWDSIPGRNYTIFRKTNLVSSVWQPIYTFMSLTNRSIFTDTNLLPTAFYYLDTP